MRCVKFSCNQSMLRYAEESGHEGRWSTRQSSTPVLSMPMVPRHPLVSLICGTRSRYMRWSFSSIICPEYTVSNGTRSYSTTFGSPELISLLGTKLSRVPRARPDQCLIRDWMRQWFSPLITCNGTQRSGHEEKRSTANPPNQCHLN